MVKKERPRTIAETKVWNEIVEVIAPLLRYNKFQCIKIRDYILKNHKDLQCKTKK